VHDEGTGIHSSLGGFDEVLVMCSASPRGVYVCVGMEYGQQVLPFASIPSFSTVLDYICDAGQLSRHQSVPVHGPPFGQLSQLVSLKSEGVGSVVSDRL
jgi:hypothetical protein